MATYYGYYIVVEPTLGASGVVAAVGSLEAARTYGLEHKLGGKWVAVQPLAGIGCERYAKWERVSLAGPECEPSVDLRGQP